LLLFAGEEQAVAATKTYTAELLAVAMLSAALLEEPLDSLLAIPALMTAALASEDSAAAVARAVGPIPTCFVLGCGYEYATVREWALKLQELSRVAADPYSTADFQHGPITLVEPDVRVLAVAPAGRIGQETRGLIGLLTDRGAKTLILSDDPSATPSAQHVIAFPPGISPHLAPIVTILPAQLFALHLALGSGLDPERPHHIAKVTLTR
jgi:glutamine---fructose-6-phosphate transaminase (isomerizing)